MSETCVPGSWAENEQLDSLRAKVSEWVGWLTCHCSTKGQMIVLKAKA